MSQWTAAFQVEAVVVEEHLLERRMNQSLAGWAGILGHVPLLLLLAPNRLVGPVESRPLVDFVVVLNIYLYRSYLYRTDQDSICLGLNQTANQGQTDSMVVQGWRSRRAGFEH